MSDEELERMAEAIVRLRAEILRRRETETATAAELTTPQALALRSIVLEGPLRMGALADQLGVSVATASRTVDALESRGLAERRPDSADARAVLVCATARGKRQHAVSRQRFTRALARLLEELSEHERRQLGDSLETVGRLLAPERSTDREAS